MNKYLFSNIKNNKTVLEIMNVKSKYAKYVVCITEITNASVAYSELYNYSFLLRCNITQIISHLTTVPIFSSPWNK